MAKAVCFSLVHKIRVPVFLCRECVVIAAAAAAGRKDGVSGFTTFSVPWESGNPATDLFFRTAPYSLWTLCSSHSEKIAIITLSEHSMH